MSFMGSSADRTQLRESVSSKIGQWEFPKLKSKRIKDEKNWKRISKNCGKITISHIYNGNTK